MKLINLKRLIQKKAYSSRQKSSKSADYVLISPEVKVLDFKVLKEEISNHLPLFLEFK